MTRRDGVRWAVQMALGGVLIAAGISKLKDAHAFAEVIANFRMLPPEGNRFLAIVLPWNELAAGLMLIAGLWTRAVAVVSTALFGAFGVAVVAALARGLDIQCGCFGTESAARVGLQTLTIDAVGLGASIWLMLKSGWPTRSAAPGG